MSNTPLSLIDFCTIYAGERPRDALKRSLTLAKHAEALGFHRIWYAEHHNVPQIASSAPAIIISHIAANTNNIRLGAGGVMLPNHSPYIIAEQFGTLAELYPNRIDLGLGRAPGTDIKTLGRALRRSVNAAEHFSEDVLELAGYLSGESPIRGVTAIPGKDSKVPLFILGSSLFGADLAAKLGLPYSFASHFAPTQLKEAIDHYRIHFQPSDVLSQPYVIAAVNVTAADTEEQAQAQALAVKRNSLKVLLGQQGINLTNAQLENLLASKAGDEIGRMFQYHAVGTTDTVYNYLSDFQKLSNADELMISNRTTSESDALRSLELIKKGWH